MKKEVFATNNTHPVIIRKSLMSSMTQSEKSDDFDLMFNYYYDVIHEIYRNSWNSYFRMVFGKPIRETQENS